MLLSAIGAGVGLAGSLFGGIEGAKEKKKAQGELDRMKGDNENWFNREYYEDYTKRSDVRNLLGRMRERFRERNDAARNTAAVMGGTPESGLAVKKENNRAYADAAGQIASSASSHRDNVMNRYQQRKMMLANQQIANYTNQGRQWNNFMSNSANVAGAAVGSLGNVVFGKGLWGKDGRGGNGYGNGLSDEAIRALSPEGMRDAYEKYQKGK